MTLLVSAATAYAQAPPTFEVASIRPATEQAGRIGVGLHIDGSQVRITAMSLKDYILTAYRLRPQQIIGPSWLGQPRFDIAAKIPEGESSAHVPEMLQVLLTERFQMKAHRETRELPVYALRVGSGGAKTSGICETGRCTGRCARCHGGSARDR